MIAAQTPDRPTAKTITSPRYPGWRIEVRRANFWVMTRPGSPYILTVERRANGQFTVIGYDSIVSSYSRLGKGFDSVPDALSFIGG